MPAKIIETNDSPLNTIEVDGITVDLIENALKNAREEMDALVSRTALSPGIREQGDCFPMIANREGKMVVGQFGSFIHGFTEAYDEEIEEGDIILTNDPYMCNAAVSHLPDWMVLKPVFRDGRHVAWSAMFGHMSDNGGMVPGSIPTEATTIFQEGIRIPPIKLYKKGELQSDVLELILHNVRTSQWNRFDLNDGFYDLVDVRIPQGTLLKPNYPAALSGRTHALGRIFDVLGALLGMGAPNEMLNAAGFSDSPHLFFSGYDNKGEWFQLFQIGFGGVPGRPVGDGPDGHSLWPSFTNVPNEFVEAYFPLRVEKYEFIIDSGGAGLHRGGNGLSVAYRFLVDGHIGIHDDRWLTYPWGVNGGKPGMRSTKLLVRCDGSEEYIPAKCEDVKVQKGDLLYFNTWGGGGWGNPLLRDPNLVTSDVSKKLVSAKGARRYGVVINDDLTLNDKETDSLRAEMSKDTVEDEMFNFGGTIEEIKSKSLEETHLEAPVSPTFSQ